MDKNKREKEMILAWGLKNSSKYNFSAIDKEKDSYFKKRGEDSDSYIREYGFETMPELMNELEVLWKEDEVMDQLKTVVGIAAFKNKPSEVMPEEVKADSRKDAEDQLPAFRYNF